MFQPFIKSGNIETDLPLLIEAQAALSDPDLIATLANTTSLLNWYLDDINWVGFYLWNSVDDELVLGPFQGLPACIRIKSGRGVCGKAAETMEIQRVDDVNLFPGHIACDSVSRSELVIPLLHDGVFFGVLDVDSPIPGRFSAAEAEALNRYCRKLMESLPAVQ